LKLTGDAGVLAWLDAQIIETLYLSTISLAELRFGIAALPSGKRFERCASCRKPHPTAFNSQPVRKN
jgi:hypothetical protein